MVALPNRDRTLRATLVLPDEWNRQLQYAKAMEAFLSAQFPDVLPYLTETPEQLADRPVGEIVSVRCDVLHHAGSVLLLGDAAHAVVPFMGQGVNIGLEDCQVLAESLDEYGSDLEQAFGAVSERQLPEGLACADLSEWNYSELTSGRPAAACSWQGVTGFAGELQWSFL